MPIRTPRSGSLLSEDCTSRTQFEHAIELARIPSPMLPGRYIAEPVMSQHRDDPRGIDWRGAPRPISVGIAGEVC